METQTPPSQSLEKSDRRTWLRPVITLVVLFLTIGFLLYRIDLAFPRTAPNLNNTLTPMTQLAPDGIGSYDLLGYAVSKEEADRLLKTEDGRAQLSPDNSCFQLTTIRHRYPIR